MRQVTKYDTVATIWAVADTAIEVSDEVSGVAVETVDRDGSFDGTIVYFPGLKANDIGEILDDQEEEVDTVPDVPETRYRVGEVFYVTALDSKVLLAQVGCDMFALISFENGNWLNEAGNRLNEAVHVDAGAARGLTQAEFDQVRGRFEVERCEEEL